MNKKKYKNRLYAASELEQSIAKQTNKQNNFKINRTAASECKASKHCQ